MTRTRFAIPATAIGIAVAITMIIVVATGHSGPVGHRDASYSPLAVPTLERVDGGSENQCQSGVTQAAFAIDDFRLRSRSATPTVTKVDLADVRGDLHLAHAVLVPFFISGTAFKWGDPIFAKSPGWSLRQQLPAHLHYVPQLAGVPPAGDRTVWELLVDVHSTIGGTAQHVLITYLDGGHTWQVTGKDLVGVQPTSKQCKVVLGYRGPG
jgi:hypothetical protein